MKNKLWFDEKAEAWLRIRGIFAEAGNAFLLSNLLESVYKQAWCDCMDQRVAQRIELEKLNSKKEE